MNVDDFPWLEDHHRMIRDTVREFASKEVAPGALERDRDKTFPRELFARMAELGLTGVPVPEEWGGAGLDTLAYAITMEEIARADASLALTLAAHTSLGTWPIYAFGDESQRKRWVPQLASGKELAAFALTEPDSGSDAQATRTVAVASPDIGSPVTPFTTAARLTYSPSPTPAPTASSSFTVRTSVAATTRPSQRSSRPAIDGSVGTPSTSVASSGTMPRSTAP